MPKMKQEDKAAAHGFRMAVRNRLNKEGDVAGFLDLAQAASCHKKDDVSTERLELAATRLKNGAPLAEIKAILFGGEKA